MKAINIKLATFTFAAMLLASCSDNGTDVPTSPAINPNLQGLAVTSNTDASTLAARVTNYKASGTRATRASYSEVFGNFNSMPAQPTPQGNELTGDIYSSKQAGNYIVSSNKTIGLGNVSNTNIYVTAGTLELSNVYQLGDNVNIYVMPNATLKASGDNLFNNQKITVYNYGSLDFTGNSINIYGNVNIYNNGDLNWTTKNVMNQGSLYIGGDANVAGFETKKGSKTYITGNLDLAKTDVKLDGENYFGGFLKAKTLYTEDECKVFSNCGIEVEGEFKMDSNGQEMHVAYLKAGSINQSSASVVYLKNNSYIVTPNYVNHNAGVGSITLEGYKAIAYIVGNKLHYNQSDGNKNDLKMFRTTGDESKIYFSGQFCEEWSDNPVETTLNNEADVINVDESNINDFTIKKDGCNPGHNDNGNPEPEPTPKPDLELITTIDYPNHTHNISATCIKEYNNKMYMSYHTRGAGHGACLEVFSPVTNNKVTMLQYLQDKEDLLDFNHLIVDGNVSTPRLLTVGSHAKKGAMAATIDIANGGLLNTESKEITEDNTTKKVEPIQMIQYVPATAANAKLGYDENCIVRDGNNYVVATTRGYVVYDAESLNEVNRTTTVGRVKHLSLNGDKIASLTFDRQVAEDEDTLTAIPAHINIFPAGTTDFSVTPEHSFSVKAITPNNGKNTIALVGDRVYACLGGEGFYCYDLNGNVKWHYQIKNALNTTGNKAGQYKAAANGCYIGGKYIYVAYGSAGLKVLDMDGNLVAERYKKVEKGNYSANYVTVYNGYIYVAHGKKRLQVFRLYNCDADTNVDYNK